ncbi:MAG: rhomboid family intramembrane serine protease [Thomasclavelia sp.]|jgi:rhomboid protease GluP|nr:rhomboid family intramembrane serine protease [Thomasclavelia sp.]
MITIVFIGICIVLFLITFLDKQEDKVQTAIKYGALYPPYITEKKQYWRLIASNFLHVDIMHLFMNCYSIYFVGTFLERFLGSTFYIYLIIMAGAGTSLLTYYMAMRKPEKMYTVTLGASGIFFGFLGAIIMMGVIYQGPFMELLKEFAYIIIINLAFTFLDKRISKTGHIGGLIGGMIGMGVIMFIFR